MKETDLIIQFTDALAHEQGWYDVNRRIQTVARRLNNPLCLEHWKKADGAPYPEYNGYVEFPDPDAGWRAGRAQCKINILKRKLTWREFFAGRAGVYRGFCPGRGDAKQDPVQYARKVMERLKVAVSLDTPIVGLVATDGLK